jgi:hypothetical protein
MNLFAMPYKNVLALVLGKAMKITDKYNDQDLLTAGLTPFPFPPTCRLS